MAAWAEEEGFQYEVWTDGDDRTLSLHYGALSRPSSSVLSRVTMLLGADGALLLEYTEGVDFGTHPAQVLEDCAVLFGG